MNRPRWKKVWVDLTGNKTRTLLVVLSIAVGVFAVGTVGASYLVLSRTFSAGYLAAHPAHATLTVALFDEGLVDVVRRVPGVAAAEARRMVTGLKVQTGPNTWMAIGLTAIPDFRAIRILQLRPEQGRPAPSLHGLLLERTSLPLTHVQVGEAVTLELPDGRRRLFTVEGTVYNAATPPPTFTNQLEGYINLDTLEALGEARGFNQLNLTVTEEPLNQAHIEAVARVAAEKIEKGGYTVFTTSVPVPGQHPAYQVIQSLILLLGIMGLFSLVLSGFLVINTLNGLLAQHIRQIGMMKAVGARSGQLAGMYLTLVLGFGLLAFGVAAPLATAAAYGLCALMASWINFDLAGFAMPPAVTAVMAGISLGVPVLAALLPVRSGTQLTVREAITSYGLGRGQFGKSRFDQALERIRFLSRPVLISLRNTFRRKSRLALTLITLTLAGAVFIAVFNVRGSLTLAFDEFLNSFFSDLNLSFTGGPQQIERVRQTALGVPGVLEVEGWVTAVGKLLDAEDRATADFVVVGVPADSRMFHPIIEQGRWLRPDDQAAVVVGTDFLARYPETRPGSRLRLTLNDRKVTLTVVGIMRFLGAGAGTYTTYGAYEYLARLTGAGGNATEYRLRLAQSDPASQQRAAQALGAALKARGLRNTIQTGAELKAQVGAAINIIIAFLAPMAIMVGLVGALGLMGTMSLNVIERTREIGVLRAVGAANAKVFQIVVVEGLMIGLVSWALGIVLSLPISAALAAVVGGIFQVQLAVYIAPEGFLIWLAVVLVLAWLASLLPAWGAVRLTVRDVLAYE